LAVVRPSLEDAFVSIVRERRGDAANAK
jgi:hypothetical protein